MKGFTLARAIEKWILHTEFRNWFTIHSSAGKPVIIAPWSDRNGPFLVLISDDQVTSAYWGFTIKAADPHFFPRLNDFLSFLRGHHKRESTSLCEFMNAERVLLRKTLGRRYVT